jgi:predicted enzyme related to lactoylglutathione lyase
VKGTPDGWLVYFLAPESAQGDGRSDAPRREAVRLEHADPEVGAFSMFADPTGAMFALFEPAMSAKA